MYVLVYSLRDIDGIHPVFFATFVVSNRIFVQCPSLKQRCAVSAVSFAIFESLVFSFVVLLCVDASIPRNRSDFNL